MRPHRILYPFGALYGLIVKIRNLFYDKGLFKEHATPTFSICVGNLSVGGTGKTPMIEYLVGLFLNENKNIAVLSRGYKRRKKGFIELNSNNSAIEVGDEPFQISKKFKEIKVFVDEDRVEGVNKIWDQYPKTDIFLLDDAFQHRSIKAHLNILLTRFDQLYTDDYYLPAGYLRDHISRADQAQAIVVTKCPENLDIETKLSITSKLNLNTDQQIFFSLVKYDKPKSLFDSNSSDQIRSFNCIAIAGIAYPEPFTEHVMSLYNIFDSIYYPDHYSFNSSDISNWLDILRKHENPAIITTEKDAVRLLQFEKELKEIKVFYIPIKLDFQGGEKDFKRLVDIF